MSASCLPSRSLVRVHNDQAWAGHGSINESWELVDEASDIAERDVARLLLDADADELRDTRHAQLTTFVSSLMVLDAAERLGLEPSFCAGHSLGEYTALTATGALGFDEGVRLVCERADAMHQAGVENPGTMAAVLGLDDDQVEVACRRADSDVWVANFNAPGQVVIAGSPEGVAAAGVVAKELGAKKVMPLQVSGAFHTPFMTAARDRLRKAIAEANPRDTEVPVISNVDASGPQHRVDVVEPFVGATQQPCALEALPVDARGERRHRVRRARARRCVDRYGQAHCRVGSHDLGLDARRSREVARVGQCRIDAPRHPTRRRAPLCSRTSRRQSCRWFVHADRRTCRMARCLTVGDLLGQVGDTDVRSPFAGVLQNYIAVDGERVTMRQPIAWLRTI